MKKKNLYNTVTDYLQARRDWEGRGQCCQRASMAVEGRVRAATRSDRARFSTRMFLAENIRT